MPYGFDEEHDEEPGDRVPSSSPLPQWPIFNTQSQRQATVSAADVKPEPAEHSPAKGVAPHDKAETDYLDRLVSETNPEILEGGVEIGVQLLEGLKMCLFPFLPTEGTQGPYWTKAIRELEERAKPTRTVVGVVGNVGFLYKIHRLS